ncbi:MAG: EI24 domain-containing protein [Armatimonadota bacterium]
MDALRGIGLIARTPRLWPLCLGPLIGIFVLYLLLGGVGGLLLVPRLETWLSSLPNNGLFLIAAEVLAVLLWLVLFPFLFVLLGGVLFGMIFEPLSRATEEIVLGGSRPQTASPLTAGQLFGDTIARLALNATLGVGAFLLGFVLGPIPGVLAAATIGLLDYTSPAYLRRGVTLSPQSRQLFFRRPNAATVTFALVAGLLSLLPVVGVLLMPGLVAGGTLLVLRRESEAARPVS